jgi:hypothetical protein
MDEIDAALVLETMASTFRVRNKKYGDNWKNVGAVMAALYPEGVTLRTAEDHVQFHLLSWAVGKLTRFVNSEDTDSIHDAAVYLAMIESLLRGRDR